MVVALGDAGPGVSYNWSPVTTIGYDVMTVDQALLVPPFDAGLEAGPTMPRDRFIAYYGKDLCKKRPFYNVGAGAWKHPRVQNIDIVHPGYPNNRPDIEYDITSLAPLPIEEDTAHLFYLCHVIEHVPDEYDLNLFAEIHRVMAKGGIVRFVFPNVDLALAAYERDDRAFFLDDWWRGPKAKKARAEHPTSQLLMDFIATRAQVGSPNDGVEKLSAREFEEMLAQQGPESAFDAATKRIPLSVQKRAPGCHINWWNPAKLQRVLKAVGFSETYESAYLQSRVYPMRDKEYFDLTFPHMSGYVEAIK